MLRITLVAVMALLVAACQTDDSTAGGTPAPGDHFVEVVLTEHEIEMPDSAPAGEVSFRLNNQGEQTHSFQVEGDGVDEQLRLEVMPGATEVLNVELEPGTYTVWCPIADHRDRGMEAEIEITEATQTDGAPLGDEAVDPTDSPEAITEDSD